MNKATKLDAALAECSLHSEILSEALNEIAVQRPFDAQAVKSMPGGVRRLLDQIAYRFIKLQDTLGERFLSALLGLAEEPLSDATPFQQKLRRLERLGAVPSADAWRLLRELRNQIAHEYPDAPAIQAAMIEALLDGARTLIAFSAKAWEFKARL